ncbi:MAG: hypothetical protein ACKVUS_22075 [Saprospiraceae bacterium]
MNTKVLLAALAGGVASYLLGWCFYGMLLSDFFAANVGTATGVMRDNASLQQLPLIAGNLIFGLLYATIFSRWAGITTFMGGAMGGAWVGLLMGLGSNLVSLGVTNIGNPTSALVDALVAAVIGAIVGGVVGWVLGYGDKK